MKHKKEAELGIRPFSQPDRFLDEAVGRVRNSAEQLRKDAVAFVKREPEKALLSAVAVGFVLRALPILPILGLVARVAAGVFKPVALSYVAAKVIGSSQRRGEKNTHP